MQQKRTNWKNARFRFLCLALISSFAKTRNFPTLSGSNKMKSFESYPSCVGEVPAACRFERKARLRLASLHCKLGSERSERSSRRKLSKVFQNSTFALLATVFTSFSFLSLLKTLKIKSQVSAKRVSALIIRFKNCC